MDAMHELLGLLLVIWFSGERHGFLCIEMLGLNIIFFKIEITKIDLIEKHLRSKMLNHKLV